MRMDPEANNFKLVWRNGEVKDADRARCFELSAGGADDD